VSGNVKKRNS